MHIILYQQRDHFFLGNRQRDHMNPDVHNKIFIGMINN